MTERLFLDQPALGVTTAMVVASGPDGVELDRTVFYARGGGQPGDTGTLRWEGGTLAVSDTVKAEGEAIRHVPADGAVVPPVGSRVEAVIDWPRRHAHMRMHTALHLLCSLIKGAAVTGGAVGAEKSRLDFDLPVPPAREDIEAGLTALVAADHPVGIEWVDESVLDTDPGLVRTLSVQPPRGQRAPAPDPHRHRGSAGGPAALRRHACRPHRADRADPRAEDREQGQAEPPHHHRPGVRLYLG